MATLIDAFVMSMGWDTRDFKKGSKEIDQTFDKTKEKATKASKEMEAQAKKAMEGFANLRREIIAMFAVFTAGVGLKDFTAQTIESDAATGRLAKNLDMTTESLSAWQGVLRRSGGTAQDANAGLQTLVDSFQQIQLTGTSPLIPYLNLLKISLADLKNPSETLLKIADAFHKMDPAQAAAIGKGMGLSPAMISLLEKGRGAVSAMLAEQQKIGVISDADAAAAQRLQNTLSSLKQAAERLGNSILTVLAPALDLIAQGLTAVTEFAKANKPIMVGLFLGIAAAAAVAAIPLAAVVVEALTLAAPFIAAGVAIGALVEIVMTASHWFMNLVRGNEATRDAMAEVGGAARDLWSAIKDLLAPFKPMLDGIVGAFKAIGSAIADAFGGASMAVARTFVNFLANQFHVIADAIRVVTALVRGDLKGAMAAARDVVADEVRSATGAQARGSGAPAAAPSPAKPAAPAGPAAPVGSSAAQAAASMIKSFEGFVGRAKWDRNAYRAGYGSDTVTDPTTGRVTKVTPGTTVNREQAEADLTRRIQGEFMPKVAAAVGGAWSKFSNTTKAALTSIAYNYGSLPRSVLAAARTGDLQKISAAIDARAGDNGGINAARRRREAAAVLAAANSNTPIPVGTAPGVRGLAAGAAARYAAISNDNSTQTSHTDVRIDRIEISTRATDANGIAREIGPAIRRRAYVTQANTGLQ